MTGHQPACDYGAVVLQKENRKIPQAGGLRYPKKIFILVLLRESCINIHNQKLVQTQLTTGHWPLDSGYWTLATGLWPLATGHFTNGFVSSVNLPTI